MKAVHVLVAAGACREPAAAHLCEGLGALTSAIAGAGGKLRRHAHDAFPTREQEPLERPRDVTAVLKRPHPLAAQTPRPPQQVLERAALGAHRPIREHLARRRIHAGRGRSGLSVQSTQATANTANQAIADT
jgi:hypothetical protein